MKKAYFRCSAELLETLFCLPKGVEIQRVDYDVERDEFSFAVQGETLPVPKAVPGHTIPEIRLRYHKVLGVRFDGERVEICELDRIEGEDEMGCSQSVAVAPELGSLAPIVFDAKGSAVNACIKCGAPTESTSHAHCSSCWFKEVMQ